MRRASFSSVSCRLGAGSPPLPQLRWLAFWVAAFLVALPGALATESPAILIIVHPDVNERSVERTFVASGFLKKVTRWEGGQLIQPVDLNSQSKLRARFSEQVLDRSVAAVRNYWQQRIFSGRDVPPPEVESESAVVKYVAKHPGAIGYVSEKAELRGVKVLGLR